MNPKDLLIVLEKLRLSLEQLLENAQLKQKALIKMNDEQLVKAINDEEKLIRLVKVAENERINKMNEIYKLNGINQTNYKLALFIKTFKNSIDEKGIKLLSNYEKILKKLTVEVMNVNRQNLFLIEHSRMFITSLMGIVYQDKNRSLFDKKV
ncbi:MAG TPA: hypothetical protein PL041_01290 [Melioribacteraceae bacterium]|nr:hypothetical protein [Melioribacteraceae bacterium]